VAFTYGVRTNWFRNVLAADGCAIRHTAPEHYSDTSARVIEADPREMVPVPFWLVLRLLGVRQFVVLESGQNARQATRAAID